MIQKKLSTFLPFLIAGILLNPFLVPTLFPVLAKFNVFFWLCSLSLLLIFVIGAWKKERLGWMWRNSGTFNAVIMLCMLAIVLCSNRIFAGQYQIFRLGLYLGIFALMLRTFYIGVVRHEKVRWQSRIGTVGLGLLAVFLLMESISLFLVRSHGSYPEAFANLAWHHRYWFPQNKAGYREDEFAQRRGKKRLLVIGDSFTAGTGIAEADERFTEKTEALLGERYDLLNLGQEGSDTRAELRRLDEVNLEADGLVLAYCLNDIHAAAAENGIKYSWTSPETRYPAFLRPVLHYSHFFNFLYGYSGYGASAQPDYLAFLQQCFESKAVLNTHFKTLKRVIVYAQKHGMKLNVLVFPLMQDVESSKPFTSIVSNYFRMQGIPVADLALELSDMPLKDRIVHEMDPHPSVQVHEEVAGVLSEMLNQ